MNSRHETGGMASVNDFSSPTRDPQQQAQYAQKNYLSYKQKEDGWQLISIRFRTIK